MSALVHLKSANNIVGISPLQPLFTGWKNELSGTVLKNAIVDSPLADFEDNLLTSISYIRHRMFCVFIHSSVCNAKATPLGF